jgi:2,3-diketo-5-methylthio-1-phosphopentane phosphatase
MQSFSNEPHFGRRTRQAMHEQHSDTTSFEQEFDRPDHRSFLRRTTLAWAGDRRDPKRRCTVLCDFDGTVTKSDVTDDLLARFGKPGWQRLEAQWRAGAIGSRACMAGQVALLDCSREELDAHLCGVAIDPAFKQFATAVRARGAAIEIVSDGLDHACRVILGRHGLESIPLKANHLVQTGARSWRLEFPYAAIGCRAGHCKCVSARAHAAEGAAVLLIGDGASDFCVARRASHVFARGALLAHCAAAALPHRAVPDFDEALALLPLALDGSLAHASPEGETWQEGTR